MQKSRNHLASIALNIESKYVSIINDERLLTSDLKLVRMDCLILLKSYAWSSLHARVSQNYKSDQVKRNLRQRDAKMKFID